MTDLVLIHNVSIPTTQSLHLKILFKHIYLNITRQLNLGTRLVPPHLAHTDVSQLRQTLACCSKCYPAVKYVS